LRYNRNVRFIGYIPATVRGAKIEWDVDVELSPEVRGALKPQDVETLRPGKLRRPFRVTSPRAGTRGRPFARQDIEHPKGALVFATADESWFWFEAPDEA
jgi:hypothetical protein